MRGCYLITGFCCAWCTHTGPSIYTIHRHTSILGLLYSCAACSAVCPLLRAAENWRVICSRRHLSAQAAARPTLQQPQQQHNHRRCSNQRSHSPKSVQANSAPSHLSGPSVGDNFSALDKHLKDSEHGTVRAQQKSFDRWFYARRAMLSPSIWRTSS